MEIALKAAPVSRPAPIMNIFPRPFHRCRDYDIILVLPVTNRIPRQPLMKITALKMREAHAEYCKLNRFLKGKNNRIKHGDIIGRTCIKMLIYAAALPDSNPVP